MNHEGVLNALLRHQTGLSQPPPVSLHAIATPPLYAFPEGSVVTEGEGGGSRGASRPVSAYGSAHASQRSQRSTHDGVGVGVGLGPAPGQGLVSGAGSVTGSVTGQGLGDDLEAFSGVPMEVTPPPLHTHTISTHPHIFPPHSTLNLPSPFPSYSSYPSLSPLHPSPLPHISHSSLLPPPHFCRWRKSLSYPPSSQPPPTAPSPSPTRHPPSTCSITPLSALCHRSTIQTQG